MVNIEKIGGALVVSFQELSKLNVSVSQKVKLEITRLIDQPDLKLIVDLSGILYIDSSGFGALLSILRACKSNNAQLRIVNTSPEVMELVKLLQLHSVFDFRDTVDSAINSFE